MAPVAFINSKDENGHWHKHPFTLYTPNTLVSWSLWTWTMLHRWWGWRPVTTLMLCTCVLWHLTNQGSFTIVACHRYRLTLSFLESSECCLLLHPQWLPPKVPNSNLCWAVTGHAHIQFIDPTHPVFQVITIATACTRMCAWKLVVGEALPDIRALTTLSCRPIIWGTKLASSTSNCPSHYWWPWQRSGQWPGFANWLVMMTPSHPTSKKWCSGQVYRLLWKCKLTFISSWVYFWNLFMI